jgi:hypothetical protein
MKGFPWVRLCLEDIKNLYSLHSSSFVVFFSLLGRMNEYGYVYASRKQIQKDTGLPKGTVSKALAALGGAQVVEQWERGVYRVSPRYAQVGKRRYKPEVPGLVDLATGEIRRFKFKGDLKNDSRNPLAAESNPAS